MTKKLLSKLFRGKEEAVKKKKKKRDRDSFSNLGSTNRLKKADTTPMVRLFQEAEDGDQIQTKIFNFY